MAKESSKYIQINDWCLVEYIYNPMGSGDNVNYSQTDQKTFLVKNEITDEYSFTGDFSGLTSFTNKINNHINVNAMPINAQKSMWVWSRLKTSAGSESDIWDYEYDPNDEYSNIAGKFSYRDLDSHGAEIPRIPTSLKNIYYDKIRLHVATGFSMSALDGLVFELVFKECSEKDFVATQFFFNNNMNDDQITYNPTPLMLSQKSYNKYIEFYVPSLYRVQTDFWQNLSSKADKYNFEYYYSHPGKKVMFLENIPDDEKKKRPAGYMKDSPLYINFYELNGHFKHRGCDFYYVRNKYTASIKESDIYSPLACVIKEADNGDYFEYYPTWDGAFIDEYIQQLNSGVVEGDNSGLWVVSNEIAVYENGGTELKVTDVMSTYQTSNFDRPMTYRPILKYANIDTSVNLVYTMRLMNTSTGESISRTAATAIKYGNCARYGKEMMSINVNSNTRAINVYNKIIKMGVTNTSSSATSNVSYDSILKALSTNLYAILANMLAEGKLKNDVYNSIIKLLGAEMNPLLSGILSSLLADSSLMAKLNGGTTVKQNSPRLYVDKFNICMNTEDKKTTSPGLTYFGQNQLTIYISKFDNHFEFSTFNILNSEYEKMKMNDFVGKMSMKFILDNNDRKQVDIDFGVKGDEDGVYSLASDAKFAVTIPSSLSTLLLAQKKDNNFYIVVTNEDGDENVLYVGNYKDISLKGKELYNANESLIEWIVSNKKYIQDAYADLAKRMADLNKKIKQINATIDANNAAISAFLEKNKDSENVPTLNNIENIEDDLNDDEEGIDEEDTTGSSNSDNKTPGSSNNGEGGGSKGSVIENQQTNSSCK